MTTETIGLFLLLIAVLILYGRFESLAKRVRELEQKSVATPDASADTGPLDYV